MLAANDQVSTSPDESDPGMPIPEEISTAGGDSSLSLESGQDAAILLVDDRADKLLALESILADLGQRIVLASSGTDALRLLLQQEFAVVILDVNMPGMDGFETAALIRQRQNSELTPIIFISAINYSETHLARGYGLGAVDYIMAPIVPEILRAKVSFFVELHKKNEQLRQQAELQARLLLAEAANSAKDRFLAMLSHELRTPLTPILFCASTLSTDEKLPEYARKDLHTLVRNVQFEARLIDDLLDISRINQGKFKLTLERTDVHVLVDSAIAVCAEEISEKNLLLRRELNATRAEVFGDSARLTQVFWNLIKNAAKFTPPGGEITIRTSSEDDSLLVEVIDTGIGIDGLALPKIFNPFEQIQSSQSGGLGLAISKAIIEQHNGSISAFSEGPGRGATFTVGLQALVIPSSSQKIPVAVVSLSEPAEDEKSRVPILLVDDHVDTANALKIFLSNAGYNVILAENIQTALQYVEQQSFGLLVCDLGLPDGRGEDFLKQLRQKGYRFPAVAFSEFGSEDDISRTRAAGFQMHLTKPVHPEQLKTAIEEALREGRVSKRS